MWYKNAFRRVVVDMHIPDWDERFLSKFDPRNYVEMLKKARAQSVVLYAHSHAGLFNYPTRIGAMHQGWKGRDGFGETLELCHQNGIAVVAYTSLIFDRWASDQHPEWRIRRVDGFDADADSRHGLCCPNSPYRDYAASWAEELLTRYPADGIRFDMTFWPAVCYCAHCQARFERETGKSLPETIQWDDPTWVMFQRKREEWLADFAGHLTATARRARAGISVEHQASTFNADWRLGVADSLAPTNDFLQGDFYGDALQGSFVRKLLYNLTPHQPYGFETSVSVSLGNHTVSKSNALLTAKACAAAAGQGAMIYIDAIDPVGTLNPRTYDRLGEAFLAAQPYDAYRGGEMAQDVAVYFSMYSKWNSGDNGKSPIDPRLAGKSPHIEAALNTCAALITHHLPFGVITRRDLDRLARHRILILPDVLMMDSGEVEAIRRFVAEGGCLYASRTASLLTETGVCQPDFMLSDVFGVHYQGETHESFTYMAPEAGKGEFMPGYSKKYPLGIEASQVIVKAEMETKILAKITLPYTDPADFMRFSSIHSNPPGVETDFPSLVSHPFGKGQVIYSAASLENADYARDVFLNTLGLFNQPYRFEADAPGSVEITLFTQADRHRLIVYLLNFQKELPNLPIDGVKVRLWLPGMIPGPLKLVPDETQLAYRYSGDTLEFESPRLDTLRAFALDYRLKTEG